MTPQDLRVWAGRSAAASSAEQPGGPQLPQSPVAGAGLWPWRRLGQELHCFKPLVPTQLPNPLSMSGRRGGQLSVGRAGHTRAHARAHTQPAQAHLHTQDLTQGRVLGLCTGLPWFWAGCR